jgi:hypothetical protein
MRQKSPQINIMKNYLLPMLLVFGLVAFLPQKTKADGGFGVYFGPGYYEPYPQYYGDYYRRYHYYDNPYWYRHHHRHWRHWREDDED